MTEPLTEWRTPGFRIPAKYLVDPDQATGARVESFPVKHGKDGRFLRGARVLTPEQYDVLDPSKNPSPEKIAKTLDSTPEGTDVHAALDSFTSKRGGVTRLRSAIDKRANGEPISADQRAKIDAFVGAMDGYPRSKVPPLYRGFAIEGATDTPEFWAGLDAKFAPGKTMEMNVSSFSSSASVARGFQGMPNGTRQVKANHTQVHLVVDGPTHALPVQNVSKFRSEKEWLTGGKFTVQSMERPVKERPYYLVRIKQVDSISWRLQEGVTAAAAVIPGDDDRVFDEVIGGTFADARDMPAAPGEPQIPPPESTHSHRVESFPVKHSPKDGRFEPGPAGSGSDAPLTGVDGFKALGTGALSAPEQEALASYQGAGYHTVNAKLRGIMLDPVDYRPDPAEDDLIMKGLDSAMSHSAVDHATTLHRSVLDSDLVFGKGSAVGAEIQDKAYMSMTTDPDTAKRFASWAADTGQSGAVLRTTIPKGWAAVKADNGLGESEVLLNRGTRLRITGDQVIGGVRTLDAEVLR